MLSDGFHDVPDGKLACVVTSLEMFAKPPLRPEIADEPWTLRRLPEPTAEEYLDPYRAVGREWLWFTRLALPADQLLARVRHPDVEVWRLEAAAGEVGILELDFRETDTCELVYLGVSAGLIGGGAARWLMNRAIERAWSRPIKRFWVHTCTLDHAGAPAFYVRTGFRPFRRQVEITDDPRLLGLIPSDAAPHVPLIRRA
ncbi:MAG TPA: GNAT family N-acetyltransferase [Phenylobacterium sp.]|nr:GNAT family N-acetyltransferase [Phenylobacterium sp.]